MKKLLLAALIMTGTVHAGQISCVTAGGTTVCSDGTTIINSGKTTIINPGREEEKENDRKDATTCVRTKSTFICF